MLLGGALGMLTAMVIDASVFAWEDVSSATASAGTTAKVRRTVPAIAVAPWFERDRRGASVALTF
jgi:hypothetical protein